MAKIRVFELAKELNLTTKELMAKLEEGHVEVASHMSTLEDDTVSRIRDGVFMKKVPNVEETRLRPTLIRRRRHADAAEEAAEAALEPARELAPPVAEEEPEPEAPIVKAEPVSKPLKGESAKIIKRAPEVPVTPAPPVESPKREAAPIKEVAKEVAAGKSPVAVEPIPEQTPAIAQETPIPDSGKIEAVEGVEATEPTEAVDDHKKGKKKIRRDMPARIIQLPDKPVPSPRAVAPGYVNELELEMPNILKQARTDVPPPDPQSAEGKKKAKRPTTVKKEEDVSADKKFAKKKVPFRHKEIVEGDALYAGARAGKGKKRGKLRPALGQKPQITVAKAIKRRIKIDETIVLSDLAKRMGIKAGDMIRTLMGMGVMATVNQTIDYDTAVLVAGEFSYEVERAGFEEETIISVAEDAPETLTSRPPVVTIMGHVDHGKTSLLDVIRKTRVTDSEAGGITQHIGAYHVETDRGQIVFLDTPGHEAFTAMRARGAKVTDIVILVVAADDGVMPQTIEAINHAKASNVPIVVAINKMDKPGADTERVQRQLSDIGLVPEEWGGEAIYVKVSAKQNTGIDQLLEMVLLQAEVLDLKANSNRLAIGYVVEAKLDAGRGPVATVLVQKGTLKAGDTVVCGVHYGKVRAMLSDTGKPVTSAGPSIPVEVIGLSGVPMAGDELVALSDEKNAKQISEHRLQKQRAVELAKNSRMSLEKLFEKMKQGEVKDLNVIIKTDVDGSMEALKDSLIKLSNEEVKINVIHSATGTITESDVSLAAVSNAIIIGFNVRPNSKVADFAHEENVDMRFHNIIYDVIKEMKDAILGMMASTFEERLRGPGRSPGCVPCPEGGRHRRVLCDGREDRAREEDPGPQGRGHPVRGVGFLPAPLQG